MKSFALVAAIAGLLTTPAMADEVWSTARGHQIVYEREAGSTAVLSYTPAQGLAKGLIFIVGLGGVSEGRTTYEAYWVEADDAGPACAAALTDAEGKTWKRWGIAEVAFAKPTFPSRITIRRGECLKGLGQPVTAQPVVGAGIK